MIYFIIFHIISFAFAIRLTMYGFWEIKKHRKEGVALFCASIVLLCAEVLTLIA